MQAKKRKGHLEGKGKKRKGELGSKGQGEDPENMTQEPRQEISIKEG